MKQTYKIGEAKMEWFAEYIAKINKRAVKLGQKQIWHEVVSEEFAEVIVNDEISYTKVFSVEVEAEVIKMEGYKFIAKIEHTYEYGNIIHSMGDVEVPQKYRTIDGMCEHCNTNRKRKFTILLQDEQGNFIQVGRSCVKDFIGYDVDSKLKYADLLGEFEDCMDELEQGGWGGNGYVVYIDIAEYLTHVETEINENGWVSKSMAEDGNSSTSSRAEQRMNAYNSKNKESISTTKFIQEALEWIKTTTDTSREYMSNLQILCKQSHVKYKDMGYVASLLATYKKHLEFMLKKEMEARAKVISNHVGTVGKREVFELTLARENSFDTEYGRMCIYSFLDANGNVLVWKTSNYLELEIGGKIKLKGTIKEHGEYRDEKQTVITRCAVVK